jgi:hypothetical protein
MLHQARDEVGLVAGGGKRLLLEQLLELRDLESAVVLGHGGREVGGDLVARKRHELAGFLGRETGVALGWSGGW